MATALRRLPGRSFGGLRCRNMSTFASPSFIPTRVRCSLEASLILLFGLDLYSTYRFTEEVKVWGFEMDGLLAEYFRRSAEVLKKECQQKADELMVEYRNRTQ